MPTSGLAVNPQAAAAFRNASVLVVDGDAELRRKVSGALRDACQDVREVESGDSAIQLIGDPEAPTWDVVLTELGLPGADGLAVLRAALEREPRTGVVFMTASSSLERVVEAMRIGAIDFIQKPFDVDQLVPRLFGAADHGRLLRVARASASLRATRFSPDVVVSESPAMCAAIDLAGRAAPTRSTVLISGETGTGKEIVAGLIHGLSARASGPFVKVNCAALPETLLESELFGHERGAFTGADRQRIGRFEQASGGTLFLDEIGDMSPATQAKLLRVLEDQEFNRLGGTHALRTDARIVAATNQDLDAAIRAGRFREDLFFRLNVIGIHLPPLRERVEDTMALATAFLRNFAAESGRAVNDFSEAALRRICAYRWPGNVRELRNVIERALLMSEGERLEAGDLHLPEPSALETGGNLLVELPRQGIDMRQVERELILAALHRTGFVQKEAADLLRVSRRKLNYMIARMGLTHPNWRRNRPRLGNEASDEADRQADQRELETSE